MATKTKNLSTVDTGIHGKTMSKKQFKIDNPQDKFCKCIKKGDQVRYTLEYHRNLTGDYETHVITNGSIDDCVNLDDNNNSCHLKWLELANKPCTCGFTDPKVKTKEELKLEYIFTRIFAFIYKPTNELIVLPKTIYPSISTHFGKRIFVHTLLNNKDYEIFSVLGKHNHNLSVGQKLNQGIINHFYFDEFGQIRVCFGDNTTESILELTAFYDNTPQVY